MGVVLVTRQACHLCEDALRLLEEFNVHPELADVDADNELHRLYDFRVPVVLIDGVVAAEGRITREQLSAALSGGREGVLPPARAPVDANDIECSRYH